MTNVQKEDIHDLLKTFFNEKGLVRQHLDSYNEFIDHGLQEVVDEVAEIPIEVPESPYKVKLGQIWVIDPQSRITGPYATEVDGTKHEIYPMEARLRNLAYSAPIALEMTPVVDGFLFRTFFQGRMLYGRRQESTVLFESNQSFFASTLNFSVFSTAAKSLEQNDMRSMDRYNIYF